MSRQSLSSPCFSRYGPTIYDGRALVGIGDVERQLRVRLTTMAEYPQDDHLNPEVVVGEDGWWRACGELDFPGYDPSARTGGTSIWSLTTS